MTKLPAWWGCNKPYRIIDCLVGMRSLPDNCIDLIVTSPPYNAGKEYEDDLSDKGYYNWVRPLTDEFKRILKRDGRFAVNVCFNINRHDDDGNKEVMLPYVQWLNALIDKSTMNTQEFMQYTIDKWRFNAETQEREHPAPFPVELPNRCIKFLTFKDIVLDPFLGSGTTLLACRHNDRVGLGFEMNDEYVPIIKKRILETIPRLESWFGEDDDDE